MIEGKAALPDRGHLSRGERDLAAAQRFDAGQAAQTVACGKVPEGKAAHAIGKDLRVFGDGDAPGCGSIGCGDIGLAPGAVATARVVAFAAFTRSIDHRVAVDRENAAAAFDCGNSAHRITADIET